MYKLYVLFLLNFLLASSVFAQQNFWLQKSGGSGNDEAFGVAISQNQVYTTGYFSDYSAFDNFQLAPYGGGDIFVSKQAPNGTYQWVKRFGGALVDRGICITALPNGNVCIGGIVSGTVNFGSTIITTNQGSQDIFVACLNPSGDVLWVKLFGGTGIDIISDIKADTENNIIFTGQFRGAIQIGTENYQSQINPQTQEASYDILLCKLNSTGDPIWSKHGRASRDDRSLNLAINNQNDIYMSGIFSDTLHFSNAYLNNSNNMGFIMKFSSLGDEVWFRRVQSSVTTISGIACDQDKVYLTGDFFGTQRFNTSTSNNSWQSFNNNFINKYYLGAYSADGTFLWCITEGSANTAKSKGISVLGLNQVVITGEFSCIHSTYNQAYGSGLYISRGYKDIFISAFSTTGDRLWAKQIGGLMEDEVNAVLSNTNGLPIIIGSFEGEISTPARPDWGFQSWYHRFGYESNQAIPYCNDAHYNFYASVKSLGNKDVFIANIADTLRSAFDIFKRQGDDCIFDTYPGSITSATGDSVHCNNTTLSLILPTGSKEFNGINYNYSWNDVGFNQTFNLFNTDSTHVTVTGSNTCFSFAASSFNEILESPPLPFITTTYGPILTSEPQLLCLQKIVLVAGESMTLIGNVPPIGFESDWLMPDGSVVTGNEITINSSGYYEYRIRRVDGSCEKSTCIQVLIFTRPPAGTGGICEGSDNPFQPLVLLDNTTADTVYGCPGTVFEVSLVDANLFSSGLPTVINLFAQWSIQGPASSDPSLTLSSHQKNYTINGTGPAVITIQILEAPGNTNALLTVTRNFYIVEYPLPTIEYALSGLYQNVCPGDTSMFIITSDAEITLPSSGVFNVTENPASFQTIIPGNYEVLLYAIDEQYGCEKYMPLVLTMNYRETPVLEMQPEDGIICPSDSVAISTINSSAIVWVGPTGETVSNNPILYANSPGFYYALVTDQNGCVMVSNTVNVRQFTTPNYAVNPTKICVGDSALIEVDLVEGDSITWIAPLSGSAFQQMVYEAGVYQFKITSCGIELTIDVEVAYSDIQAEITYLGDSIFCSIDTILLKGNVGNLLNYYWFPNEEIDAEIEVSQGGLYILQVEDEFGCFSKDSIFLVQNLSPAAPSGVDSILACSADTVEIDLGEDYHVFWISGDSLLQQYASSNFLYVYESSHSGLFIANYDSTNGCYSTKTPVPIEVKPFYALETILDTSICEGQALQFSFSPHLAEALSFMWINPMNISILDSLLVFEEIILTDQGSYQLIANGNENFCGSDTVSFQIDVSPIPQANYTTSAAYICTDLIWEAYLSNDSTYNAKWQYAGINSFGDTLSLSLNNTSNNPLLVVLELTSNNGCVSLDSLEFPVYLTPNVPILSTQDPVCENDSIFVFVDLAGTSTSQFNFNSNLPFTYVNNYLVHYPALADSTIFISAYANSNFCFSDTAFTSINVGKLPIFTFPDTIIFCLPDILTIESPEEFMFYAWSDGSNNDFLNVDSSGIYSLTVTDFNGCQAIDSVYAFGDYCDAEPSPNVFTPNGDGYNDNFIIKAHGMTIISLIIFNRWGTLLAEITDIEKGWNGRNRFGEDMPSGTYFYVANAKYINNSFQELKGTVQLIR